MGVLLFKETTIYIWLGGQMGLYRDYIVIGYIGILVR